MGTGNYRLELCSGERYYEVDDDFGSYMVRDFVVRRAIAKPSAEELLTVLNDIFAEVEFTAKFKPNEPMYFSFFNADETTANCRRALQSKAFEKPDSNGDKAVLYHLLIQEPEARSVHGRIKDYIASAAGATTLEDIDAQAVSEADVVVKTTVNRLKTLKDTTPDSDEPSTLCHRIVTALEPFAFAQTVPAEITDIFKNDPWIISHEFQYWRDSGGTLGTRMCWSCTLSSLLKDNKRVLAALEGA